jgi:hypothetical protein
VSALGSQTLVMTYRTPGIQVALSIEVGRGLSEGPLCVVEWSKGRGALCYSCFASGYPWPAPATRRYLTISKLRLRKKRKKRRKEIRGRMGLVGRP